MDYRKFLGKSSELVLPWGGGAWVVAAGRRLTLERPPARPGWWRFKVSGRRATPTEAAEAPELDDLPSARGHAWRGHASRLACVPDDARPRELLFLPPDEPQRFAPLVVRRWHDGAWLVEREDFEGEAEEAARAAFEGRRGLAALKGVPASLRAAFAYATVERAARELNLAWHPLEVLSTLTSLADGGPDAAQRELVRRANERQARRGPAAPRTWQAARDQSRASRLESRVARALEQAGGGLLGLRLLDGGLLAEVRYRFQEGGFVTIVQTDTLRVVDAGICLAGADDRLTLESLPGVIRESISTGQLYVTRFEEDA